MTSKDLAALLGCQATTIRRGLCVNGHYLGLRPTKLPNGRLLWAEAPALEVLGNYICGELKRGADRYYLDTRGITDRQDRKSGSVYFYQESTALII